MKTFSLIVLFLLSSFVLSKDELLQKMYDNLAKDHKSVPVGYTKYLRNVKVTIQIISKIIDKSLLTTLDKVGVPTHIARGFNRANYAKYTFQSSNELNTLGNSTSYTLQYGGAMAKGDKGRFAYFEVVVKADHVQQKEKILIKHGKGRKAWTEIKYKDRGFTADELGFIRDYLRARAESDLLYKIKTLMEITPDGDNFLTDVSNLKFLA